MTLSRSLRIPARYPVAASFRRRFHQNFQPSIIHNPKVLPYTFIAICCGGCAVGYFAKQESALGRPDLLDSIKTHVAYSLQNIREGRYYTMITSSFMHFSGIHLLCNMYALYQLGPLMIIYFGPAAFFTLWIGGSIACNASALYWDSMKERASNAFTPARSASGGMSNIWRNNPNVDLQNLHTHAIGIGASGSICSMLAVFVSMMPNHKIWLFPVPVPLPAWFAAVGFVATSAYWLKENILPWIGHAGHLGGMGFGLAYYFGRLRPWLRRFR